MEFRILGPVEVIDQGRRIEFGRRRERALLALLLLADGSVIRAGRLTDLLWDDQPPSSARASLRTHVARLRSRLTPDRLRPRLGLYSRDGGYVLDVDRDSVDVFRFRSMVQRGQVTVDPVRKSAYLRQALALWRGPFLADAASDRLRDRVGADVIQLRLVAMETAIDADLASGRHRELIGELTALTAEYPLRERFAVQLMTALYRCDMQAEALQAHERIRTQLRNSLGLDPGPAVRDLHLSILRHDPVLPARQR
jgi:DNA-binding SARP family transcriptional activator